MTASVTKILDAPSVRLGGRHRWEKRPRANNPQRHIYVCVQPGCGLVKRNEQVDGAWGIFWLLSSLPEGPPGREGSTFAGEPVPPCRGGSVVAPEPAAFVPAPRQSAGTLVAPPRQPVRRGVCSICVPPCGRPARFYPSGWRCTPPNSASSSPRGGTA